MKVSKAQTHGCSLTTPFLNSSWHPCMLQSKVICKGRWNSLRLERQAIWAEPALHEGLQFCFVFFDSTCPSNLTRKKAASGEFKVVVLLQALAYVKQVSSKCTAGQRCVYDRVNLTCLHLSLYEEVQDFSFCLLSLVWLQPDRLANDKR